MEQYYPKNMHDKPIPDINWTDKAILDYAQMFLKSRPIIYVQLCYQISGKYPKCSRSIQRNYAKIENGKVTRITKNAMKGIE